MDIIKKSWDLGFVKVAPLTNERCNYTCGYTQKKYDKKTDISLFSLFPHLTFHERVELYYNCSDLLEKKYKKKLDPRRAEFSTCSLGIGLGFLEKNYEQILNDFCIHFGGKNFSIPRYFRKKIMEKNPEWNDDWKKYMEEYASEKMIRLFDRSSLEFEEENIDLGDGLVVSTSYDGKVDETFRRYVDFRAENVKKSRELYKFKKNIKEL